MTLAQLAVLLLAPTVVACGMVPERVAHDDPRVAPLVTAMTSIDRASLGFTPIAPDATLRLESRPRKNYDAMLHVEGETVRTVAFRKENDAYTWIGEQETFEGPTEFDTADGRFHEEITITYETVPLSGAPLDEVSIRYWGPDARLSELDTDGELLLRVVEPVLREWGYRD